MNKGFIFSIEAIFAILLLITSVMIMSFYAPESNESTIILGELYGNAINNLYLSNTPSPITQTNNYYCVEYVDSDNSMTKRTLCGGYD
jgi:hypothetical protein